MDTVIKEDIKEILNVRDDLGRLRDNTILISGADSFIMSYLVYAILEDNRKNGYHTRIIALCRSKENAQKRFSGYLDDPDLLFMFQDVREPIRYDGNVDYCIHAASPAGKSSRQAYPLDTYLINLSGCENLLRSCREKNIKKFMLISSVDVYGKCREKKRLQESDVGLLDWMYKRNAYSNGKRASETLCSLYHEQYGLPCVIVRPFQVYGPGMSLADGRLHGDFIRQVIENGKISLKSDGTAQRSFMYLSDATHAMLDVLFYGKDGGVYNICDEDSECSVYGLAKLYAVASKKDITVELTYGERDSLEVKEALSVVLGDGKKLKELGWKSRISLDEGIKRTLCFYGNSIDGR